jgi:hypothetical protein
VCVTERDLRVKEWRGSGQRIALTCFIVAPDHDLTIFAEHSQVPTAGSDLSNGGTNL